MLQQLNEELKFSPEKRSHEDVMGQEREKLLETLKAVTDERDQLKLDLNDNIEMVRIAGYNPGWESVSAVLVVNGVMFLSP